MKPQDFRFSHRLRVRWSEVDMQKIVFNAHYLAYFDLGVSEYWRTLGLPYEDAMAQLGGELYLKKPRSNSMPRHAWTTSSTWRWPASGWATAR